LAELRDLFGNLGLAAAAYNAGPQRVHEFVAGTRPLPLETRNYVSAITGHPVEDWVKAGNKESKEGKEAEPQTDDNSLSCREVLALLERGHDPPHAELERGNVPNWCRYLHHPNINTCGSVHQEPGIKAASLAPGGGRSRLLKSSSR
jgi:hypothetical protein